MSSMNNKSSADNYPIGQDSWNRSKESRQHPELYSSGHGTVDLPWSTEQKQEQETTTTTSKKENKSNTESKEHNFGGHTVRHPYSARSVKRDLNNI